MSRVYQRQPGTTRPRPAAPGASTQNPRSSVPSTRGARGGVAPRARPVATHLSRPVRNPNPNPNVENRPSQSPERTVHVGDGYHMFTPAQDKREQMRRQAENEQRRYEEHLQRTRLHGIREVHRLGGEQLSEEEVRRRQAEQYRREKFARLEKSHQEQFNKKQDEQREIDERKQAARQQTLEKESRDREMAHSDGATGWTDEAREKDRRETMNRFLNRFDQTSSESLTTNDRVAEDKLSMLREIVPDVDDETLRYHLEIYEGDVDAVVRELLS